MKSHYGKHSLTALKANKLANENKEKYEVLKNEFQVDKHIRAAANLGEFFITLFIQIENVQIIVESLRKRGYNVTVIRSPLGETKFSRVSINWALDKKGTR